MSRRTALQEQLENSRRLLSQRRASRADAGSESKPVEPSLGQYIALRHNKPFESPPSAPFRPTTEAAVTEKTGGFAKIASDRIERMRSGIEAQAELIDIEAASDPVPADVPAWSQSLEVSESASKRDGAVPLWREVLEEQRGHPRPSLASKIRHAKAVGTQGPDPASTLQKVREEVLASRPSWPPHLQVNEAYDWTNWQSGPENRLATTAAGEVLDHPAQRLNPLLVVGPSGCGKSHLLWALGTSLWTQSPDMEVRLISGGNFPDELPESWAEAVQGCKGILIDDMHMIAGDDDRGHLLGMMIDWCLNLGVQVVITSDSEPSTLIAGSLARALSAGVTVQMQEPQTATLVLYLRNRALCRTLPLSDEQLQAIVEWAGSDWRRCSSGFETVALAIEAGAEPIGVSDVEILLAGESLPLRGSDGLMAWDAEHTGQRIVQEALDHVLPREAHPNVDLISELESKVDEYQPPQLIPDDSASAVDSLLERHLGREVSALEDARRRIEESGELTELEDPEPTGEHIDMMGDAFLDRLESRLRRHQNELVSLQDEMELISGQIESAEPQELVSMADRMLEIERQLSRLSNLSAGEFPTPRKRPGRPYEIESLDEYIPEGEWDIDEDSISAGDLIGMPTAPLRPRLQMQVEDSEE